MLAGVLDHVLHLGLVLLYLGLDRLFDFAACLDGGVLRPLNGFSGAIDQLISGWPISSFSR